MSFLDFFFLLLVIFFFWVLLFSITDISQVPGRGEQQVQGWWQCQFPFSCGHAGPGLNRDIQHHQWLLLTGGRGVVLEP